jgi:hypothetical protein
MTAFVRNILKHLNKKYTLSKARYDYVLALFKGIPINRLLSDDYPKEFKSIATRVGNPGFVNEVYSYLRYKLRVKIWLVLGKSSLSSKEKRLLRTLHDCPITPNAWRRSDSPVGRLSEEALQDDAYKMYVGNYDHPFNITAHQLLKHKLASGCTHSAIVFMALAKALGFKDLRLVSAVNNYSYNTKHCSGGRFAKPRVFYDYVDSHKMVMVSLKGRYVLINTSRYPLEVIDTNLGGYRIYPETLVGKDVVLPSQMESGSWEYGTFRVRAVGKDSDDYVGIYSRKNDRNVSLNGKYDQSYQHCFDYPLPVIKP